MASWRRSPEREPSRNAAHIGGLRRGRLTDRSSRPHHLPWRTPQPRACRPTNPGIPDGGGHRCTGASRGCGSDECRDRATPPCTMPSTTIPGWRTSRSPTRGSRAAVWPRANAYFRGLQHQGETNPDMPTSTEVPVRSQPSSSNWSDNMRGLTLLGAR
jgi:hypothetical protein